MTMTDNEAGPKLDVQYVHDEEQQFSLTEPLLSSDDSLLDERQMKNDPSSAGISGSERTEASTVTTDHQEVDSEGEGFVIDDYCRLDPRRFVVLSVFSLANLLGGAAWITFAPIDDVMIELYSISPQQVNWLSLIFMALYGPGTAVCACGVRKYGLRMTVMTSAFLMAIGGLLRWWSFYFIHNDNSRMAYVILLTGQGLVALSQPVFSNAPARVASAWFRHTAAAIGFTVLGSMVGMVLGQSMSPWMIRHVDQLLAGQALVMFGCAIACYVYFESEPKVPPTVAEAIRRHQQQNEQERFSEGGSRTSVHSLARMRQEIIQLLSDTQYLVLLVSFGVQYAVNNGMPFLLCTLEISIGWEYLGSSFFIAALLTLLQPWIAAAGFPGDDLAGICGSLAIIGGIVGTFMAAPLLDWTRDYNHAVHWSFLVTFIVMLGVVAVLQPNSNVWLLAAGFVLMGMTQFPLLPICLDAAAAHTYPVSEELSSAGLQFVGQYLGILLTDGMEYMLKTSSNDDGMSVGFSAPVNIAILALMFLSTVVAMLYNGDDPRAIIGDERLRDMEDLRNEERRSNNGST
jgi:MFS family permease